MEDPPEAVSPVAGPGSWPYTVRFGLQRPELVRYNRIEEVSLGVRGQLRLRGGETPLSATGTARWGTGDRHPNLRMEFIRQGTSGNLSLHLFHELEAMQGALRPFGPANSLMALLGTRDDGDYYRRTGIQGAFVIPEWRERPATLLVFAEYHEGVSKETDLSLPRLWDEGRRFRLNASISEGWEVGVDLRGAARWGLDPGRMRVRAAGSLTAGRGASAYAQAGASGWVDLPLGRDLAVALEAAAGTAIGTLPPQRLWSVGGAGSVRGLEPRTQVGAAMFLGRAEVSRRLPFGAISVFADAGWAGDPERWAPGEGVSSVGIGIGVVDGLIRIDGAWPRVGEGGFRLEVYLDSTGSPR